MQDTGGIWNQLSLVSFSVCRVFSSMTVRAELMYRGVLYKLYLSLLLIKFRHSTIYQPYNSSRTPPAP